MPRRPRNAEGGRIYHVLNRSVERLRLFESRGDYDAFERVLAEAHQQVPMRTIAYCVMPNHWHFVVWPRGDGDLSVFMKWLTGTHTTRWRVAHRTVGHGHLYQGRFKSFPIQSDKHYLTVCRYVERNALRAGLTARAERWQWGSLWRRTFGDKKAKSLLSDGPLPWPRGWRRLVNTPQSETEEQDIRRCLVRGAPFGSEGWTLKTADELGLSSTLRPRGRQFRSGKQ
ncbi:MAG: hypothetical protein AMS16_02825 [Planctomycetes bacterium DG_58]|nr:MAG: hypothetical protein AMS16_02825 [Planctomycetes bacterium DG_58]